MTNFARIHLQTIWYKCSRSIALQKNDLNGLNISLALRSRSALVAQVQRSRNAIRTEIIKKYNKHGVDRNMLS